MSEAAKINTGKTLSSNVAMQLADTCFKTRMGYGEGLSILRGCHSSLSNVISTKSFILNTSRLLKASLKKRMVVNTGGI